MGNEQNHNNDTINLLDILKYILKYKKLVILTTIIGLVVGIIFSMASFMRGEMAKKYVIKTSIAVTSQTSDGLFTSQSLNPDSTDIHLAEDMVDSVIFVIKSDRTLEKAVDELQLIGITAKSIYDNLSLSQYNKTQIIDISLYWRNAEEGIRILEAINKVAPTILVDILKIGDVRVVNDPTAKYLIGGSIKLSTWALCMLIGLIVGMGISVLIMFIKPVFVNTNDATERFGLNILGSIPKDRHYNPNLSMKNGYYEDTNTDIGDKYISITHILQSIATSNNCHTLFVTSADNGAGKTSAVSNIDVHLSELEKKVLLIDMNTEAPNLANLFLENVSYDRSLNAVYTGDVSIEDAIIPINGYLNVLPLIHDKKEIIMNESMLSIIRDKAKDYDYTIIDTSSVGGSADVLRLSQISDGCVFVIHYDETKITDIDNALDRLTKTGIPVLGCIINQTTKFA